MTDHFIWVGIKWQVHYRSRTGQYFEAEMEKKYDIEEA